MQLTFTSSAAITTLVGDKKKDAPTVLVLSASITWTPGTPPNANDGIVIPKFLSITTSPLQTRPRSLLIAKAITCTGDALCVKMRYPLSDHQQELDTYQKMMKDNEAHMGFVPILWAMEFQTAEGLQWGALCMPYVDSTLCHFMSISPRPSASEELRRLATTFELDMQQQPTEEADHHHHNNEEDGHGVPLERGGGDFETTLLTACFQLLFRLHQKGWVHGDTHLGNFMLDDTTWRVYFIDAERSFQTDDPVQHLLDTQELFGHATGLLLSLHNRSAWDMNDVWAVMSKMHPAIDGVGGLRCFMPVCTCFVHDNQPDRIRGCKLCRSELNTMQASLYAAHGLQWTAHARELAALTHDIREYRQEIQAAVHALLTTLIEYAPVIRAWMLKQQRMHRKLNVEHVALLKHLLASSSGRNTTRVKVWVNYVLFRGAIVRDGSDKAYDFAKVLALCGLHDLSRQFEAMAVGS